jgi:hypothetical protein
MSDLSSIAIQDGIDPEQLRARLRKMTDAELLRCGRDAKFMCSPRCKLREAASRMFLDRVEGSARGVAAQVTG